jgi:hypothetical protein
MATFNCTIRLTQQPNCPVCGVLLQPIATTFSYGIAICTRCRPNTGSEFTLYNPLVHDRRIGKYWATRSGLRFYQPPPDQPVALNRLWRLISKNPARYPWWSPADNMTIRVVKEITGNACWICCVEPVSEQGAFCRICSELRDRYTP